MSASWFLAPGDFAKSIILSALSCWSQTPPVERSEGVTTTRELACEWSIFFSKCVLLSSNVREDGLVSTHTEILPLLRDSGKVGLCETTVVGWRVAVETGEH